MGSVTSSGFDIRVRRRSPNSPAPHAVGTFRKTAAGTEIEATVGVGAALQHALAVVIGLIGVINMPAELSTGVPAPVVITIAVVCVIAAVIVWIRDDEDLWISSERGTIAEESAQRDIRARCVAFPARSR